MNEREKKNQQMPFKNYNHEKTKLFTSLTFIVAVSVSKQFTQRHNLEIFFLEFHFVMR